MELSRSRVKMVKGTSKAFDIRVGPALRPLLFMERQGENVDDYGDDEGSWLVVMEACWRK